MRNLSKLLVTLSGISEKRLIINQLLQSAIIPMGIPIPAIPMAIPIMAQQAKGMYETWEEREARWARENEMLDRELYAYDELAGWLTTFGADPVHVQRLSWPNADGWITLRGLVEAALHSPVPAIKPSDAQDLALRTPFSAEQWYTGCTEREVSA